MSDTTSDPENEFEREEMLPEYDFDYSKAKPNRFARNQADGSLVVLLEPDIARVFRTPEDVKNVLRALIATMPRSEPAQ